MKKNHSIKIAAACLFSILILLGCAAHSPFDHAYVSDSLKDRSGTELGPEAVADTLRLPPNIQLSDGLTEDEVIAIALWNNARFQADLQALGFARADLIEAGMLRNPVLSLLFPLGPKQLEATLNLPIDFFWQRPYKIAIAKLHAEKVAEKLVQNGLNLVREVRISFTNLHLAKQKSGIITEEVLLREEIAEIASARLRAGDVSELEETAFRLMAAQTRERAIRLTADAKNETIHLNQLLGLILNSSEIQIQISPLDFLEVPGTEELIQKALASRPDLRAAEIAVEAAGKKIGLEKAKIFNLTGILDANGEGKEGFEMGPGLQVMLPIFNWNAGPRKRAHVELEQASRNYLVVRQGIVADVLRAYNDFLAARESLEILQNEIVPAAETANESAEKAYEAGETPYFEYLEFKQGLLNTRMREAEAEAELRRSVANLQFSVGSQLL